MQPSKLYLDSDTITGTDTFTMRPIGIMDIVEEDSPWETGKRRGADVSPRKVTTNTMPKITKTAKGYITVYYYDGVKKYAHRKDSNGDEWWKEYDEHGNEVHRKDSNGDEWWKEYDEHGNEVHRKDSNGDEWWKEYDERGNRVHYKDSYGFESWRDYDGRGNVVHFKNSTGFELWREYDERGNEVHYKNSDGYEWWNDEYPVAEDDVHPFEFGNK